MGEHKTAKLFTHGGSQAVQIGRASCRERV